MTFNPKESIDFNGNTGSFIQYTYARIRSLLRKAEELGITLPATFAGFTISTKEQELIAKVAEYADIERKQLAPIALLSSRTRLRPREGV